MDKSLQILDDFPNIRLLVEDDTPVALKTDECKILRELMLLNRKISDFEEQEIFFLGGKELYFYLKNIHIM